MTSYSINYHFKSGKTIIGGCSINLDEEMAVEKTVQLFKNPQLLKLMISGTALGDCTTFIINKAMEQIQLEAKEKQTFRQIQAHLNAGGDLFDEAIGRLS